MLFLKHIRDFFSALNQVKRLKELFYFRNRNVETVALAVNLGDVLALVRAIQRKRMATAVIKRCRNFHIGSLIVKAFRKLTRHGKTNCSLEEVSCISALELLAVKLSVDNMLLELYVKRVLFSRSENILEFLYLGRIVEEEKLQHYVLIIK